MKLFWHKNKLQLIAFIALLNAILFLSCKKNSSDDIYTPPDKPGKPNIILILADDVGYEVPGYTGGQSYSTPSIDNLAQNGIRFTQCHVCPSCSPTRVELLTGKYGFRSYTGWGSLNTDQKTIANMLHDAGYKTCVAGKWQLDGGDASIRAFGFDKYRVFQPFYVDVEDEENKYRYKNPRLYQDGNYLPKSATQGKYADDMFVDYISDFIDSNLSSPFFIYFPLSLCHKPFSPTPDDAAFATWDPLTDKSNDIFFPSMVKYMDKKVQQVLKKVASSGLEKNTIIIFMGDNGTQQGIISRYDNTNIPGGKNSTTIYGTHVPLIINWPGNISPSQSSDGLIDGSDFLPTLAEAARIQKPGNFGVLDGISFYPLWFGSKNRLRDWIYCYWNPQWKNSIFRVWVQDEQYKLYDTTGHCLFYNIAADPHELNPIPDNVLNDAETARKKTFDGVLKMMH